MAWPLAPDQSPDADQVPDADPPPPSDPRIDWFMRSAYERYGIERPTAGTGCAVSVWGGSHPASRAALGTCRWLAGVEGLEGRYDTRVLPFAPSEGAAAVCTSLWKALPARKVGTAFAGIGT